MPNYYEKRDLLNQFIKEVTATNISYENVMYLLKELIPKDENGELTIIPNVYKHGFITAGFQPKFVTFGFNISNMNNWLDIIIKEVEKYLEMKDTRKLRSYFALFILLHELNHGEQYLISTGAVPSPCPFVTVAYQNLIDLFAPKPTWLPHPIKETRRMISFPLYQLKHDNYLLERNANLEAASTLSLLAFSNGDKKIEKVFTAIKNASEALGYQDSTEGSIIETHRKILMLDGLKNIEQPTDMVMSERIRYGLEINEVNREQILSRMR